MDQLLIYYWNQTVDPSDIVIHCGDFAFTKANHDIAAQVVSSLTNQLNGHKIIVKGNHDHKQINYSSCGFTTEYYQNWELENCRFVHDPGYGCIYDRHNPEIDFHQFLKLDKMTYYGHVHNNDNRPMAAHWLGVGVDVQDYRPIDITDQLSDADYQTILNTVKKVEEKI